MLSFDHVIIAVRDLDAAAARLREAYGIAAVPGGRHPGHGTGNRIAPLGPDYLELMAVVDPEEAATSPIGRSVTASTADGDRLMALCLRTGDIGPVAGRIGDEPLRMSRALPEGGELSWSLAGIGSALGPERLPFFIEWHTDPSDHPGRAAASHAIEVGGIAWVELGADGAVLERHLGLHDLDIRLRAGAAGLRGMAVRTAGGELVITNPPW